MGTAIERRELERLLLVSSVADDMFVDTQDGSCLTGIGRMSRLVVSSLYPTWIKRGKGFTTVISIKHKNREKLVDHFS